MRQGLYSQLAVARNPEKLRNFLTEKHSIQTSTIDSLLTIYAGNIKDPSAVSKALVSPLNSRVLVDNIYFGVGGAPKLRLALMPVALDDPNICESGMASVFKAIDRLSESGVRATSDNRKPLIITISTTGITPKTRDVPLLMAPLYYKLLHVPHEDKRKMESLLFNDNGKHVRSFVIIRPTLLVDNEPKGLDKVRAGWEWGAQAGEEPGPQLGYAIGRKDVGQWAFKKAIVEGGWEGKCVSLTY